MRIGGRVFVVGAVPIATAAAIALAAIVLLERVDGARTGAALAGTVYRTLLTAVVARNDYLAAGPGARIVPQRRFFALTAQARADLGRLRALRPDDRSADASQGGPTGEAEATLARYAEDMNRLVGVTVDGDAMVRDMAARAASLIALTDRALERQHASNADVLSSLSSDDRDLRAARDIVDAATAMRLALASIQIGLFDGGAGAGPAARQDNRRLLAADRARVRQLASDLAVGLGLRSDAFAGGVRADGGLFERLDALLADPAAVDAAAARPALEAAAQWAERVLKVYAAEYRSFHERVAQLVTYSVQAHDAELATQAIAVTISKLSREAAEALARRDGATAAAVLDGSRGLAETVSSLPIPPLIQGEMAEAARLWREGLARTTEGLRRQNDLISAMDAASDDMVRAARLLDAGFGENAERTARSIRLVLALGAAGGLLFGTLAALAVARSITQPLTVLRLEITRAAEDPAGVERPAGRRIEGGLRGDELGDIARAADTFLREIARREGALRRAKERADEALRTLRRTQAELIQAEKLASLGQLVAGVAHEINTPVGIALTTATALDEEARAFRDGMRDGRVSRGALDRLVARVPEGARLLVANLTRAADLIQSFKHVAVDQVSGERRPFALQTLLHETLTSLGPMLRRNGHSAAMECPGGLELDSYPGALAQVVTNLVVNASLHGLAEGDPGLITVAAEATDADRLRLTVSDTGRGIAPEHAARIFDPFFTTRRAAGSSGLGLHIVFNLVTTTLGGRIALDGVAGCGATFVVDLPRTVATTPTRLREGTPA